MSWNPQFDQEKTLYIAGGAVLLFLLISWLIFRH